jgi:1,4-dihydroxy-2-naphthoate octaprenyltransferase
MAMVLVPAYDSIRAVFIFISLHILLYPGASGFNAYYDRDTASIGMLEHPPAVTPDLLPLSLLLKVASVVTALFAGPVIACGCLLYATASVMYSWDRVRVKKHPFAGWFLTGIGQGSIMFTAIAVSLTANAPTIPSPLLLAAAVCMSLMIMAASPLLEIFQHEEDARRGDCTISRRVGIRGTLILSGVLFTMSTMGFSLIIASAVGGIYSLLFLLSLTAALFMFVRLSLRLFRKGIAPTYHSVMPVAFAASTGLNGFCALVLLMRFLAKHIR